MIATCEASIVLTSDHYKTINVTDSKDTLCPNISELRILH